MLKVRKHNLLLIACAIWTIAGINVLKVGLEIYPNYLNIGNIVITVAVFALFQHFVFGKIVKKHTKRIVGYCEDLQFFLKFFDTKAFVIMAIMITGGVYLRLSGICPDQFIAVFYTGLGASLLIAGLLFGKNYYLLRN